MGLGPPVCNDCGLIFAFNNTTKEWYCIKCDNSDVTTCLWDMDTDKINEYVENTKKYTEENK